MFKRELQSFLGILNCLSKFSPVTAEVCEPLRKVTSVKADWKWNKMYKDLYDKAQKIIKTDKCMKCCNISRCLYLETGALGVSLGARLVQVRAGMNCGHDEISDNATLHLIAFTSKILLSTKQHYSNI